MRVTLISGSLPNSWYDINWHIMREKKHHSSRASHVFIFNNIYFLHYIVFSLYKLPLELIFRKYNIIYHCYPATPPILCLIFRRELTLHVSHVLQRLLQFNQNTTEVSCHLQSSCLFIPVSLWIGNYNTYFYFLLQFCLCRKQQSAHLQLTPHWY